MTDLLRAIARDLGWSTTVVIVVGVALWWVRHQMRRLRRSLQRKHSSWGNR